MFLTAQGEVTTQSYGPAPSVPTALALRSGLLRFWEDSGGWDGGDDGGWVGGDGDGGDGGSSNGDGSSGSKRAHARMRVAVAWGGHPRTILVASDRCLYRVNIDTLASVVLPVRALAPHERLLGLWAEPGHAFRFVLVTSASIMLLDERYPSVPLLQWRHSDVTRPPTQCTFLPRKCDDSRDGGGGGGYTSGFVAFRPSAGRLLLYQYGAQSTHDTPVCTQPVVALLWNRHQLAAEHGAACVGLQLQPVRELMRGHEGGEVALSVLVLSGRGDLLESRCVSVCICVCRFKCVVLVC